jgi:alanyl aminopeptidase
MRQSLLFVTFLTACATVEAPTAKAVPAPVVAAAEQAEPASTETLPLLQLPPHTRPLSYSIELTLIPSRDRFSGREDIEVELSEPRQVVWLHGRGLHVTEATAAGQSGTWEQVHPEGVARLTFEQPLPKGRVKLHLAWDAAWDTQLSGLYLTREAGEPYVASQFETHFARRAFPCFDDPGFKTPFELALVVDAKHLAVTNTNAAEERPLEGGLKRVSYHRTAPLPTYLLDFSVGPFDVVAPPPLPPNEVRDHPLQVRGFAPKGRGAELQFALQAGGELLVALERYFGIAYPYEKLDHIALSNFGGAMENAGAITYADNLLLFKEGVSSEESRTLVASVMAHEMAHQWFGDLVTMPWWTDIWLNESFAEWLAIRTVEAWRPQLQLKVQSLGPAHRAMDDDSLVSSRTVRHPLEKMEEVIDQFDDLTYQKGSAVLAMFEAWLGPDSFRSGVHEYMTAHAHGTGGTSDLLASLAKASGKPVIPAFESFLNQAGVPLISVKVACEPKAARLELRQQRWLPVGSKADAARTWAVPFCARWGEGKTQGSGCTLLEAESATLPIASGTCPDWVFPNPAAAGYYRWSLEVSQLSKLKAKGAQLTVVERLSVANNLSAAVRSAAVLLADAMPLLEWLAQDTDGEVAQQAISTLRWVHQHGVPPSLQPRVAGYAKRLYRPRLDQIGWKAAANEPASTRRLRSALVSFLALDLRDGATAQQAAKLGRDYAGLDGKFHPDAVSPDLSGDVLAAAVKADAKLLPGLIERLGSLEDGELRQRVLRAAAATEDDRASDQVLALWKDARLRQSELPFAYFFHLQEPKMRERAWKQFQVDFDGLVPKLDPFGRGFIARVATVFCDEDHAKQVDAFFRPRVETYPEIRPQLEHALEDVRNCAALKQTQRESAVAFFEKSR